jgi:FkbM family methyltransferase
VRLVPLPDGTRIWAPNPLEAAILYREIVSEGTYERYGITIRDGDVVFDIGANIGLFAIHVSRRCPGAALHAFEPLPPLFDALSRNLAAHAPAARAYNVGLGGEAGDAVFEFDPDMTMGATMYPTALKDGADRRASMSAWAIAGFTDLHRVQPTAVTALVTSRAERPSGRLLAMALGVPLAIGREVRRRVRLQRHTCRVRTLPAAMRDAGIDEIGLAKIDVEGAEEAVLAGIDEATWPRIRQFVVEVHDVNGRLGRLQRLLESRGYRTVSAREDWSLHALLGISTLYAMRA